MAGKSSAERQALERQNAAIMAVFERAGFDQIAPDIIQPADIFLERSGEDIRARTFVFNDPEGHELCLRPDLTVPACRYHLSHAENPAAEARYSYFGPAFRFPDERLSPQEFNQAGLEWFGAPDAIAAEARMLKLAISALEAAGATGLKVTLGDVGLFGALLTDTEMPDRWRRRLRHQFWRPQAFRELLASFAAGPTRRRTSISPIIDTFINGDATAAWLEKNSITLTGTRTLEEISSRLAEKYADRSQPPLQREAIENYLGIEGTAIDVLLLLKTIQGAKAYAAACAAYERRLEAIEDLGLNPRRFKFSANFGRELEYYTGFVFQIEADTKDGPLAIAGGGRYDELLSDLGAPQKVPAIGCAIHTERLQAVLA
jgi:ATP phosphoribosyltransferase regulatory subunit